MKKKITHIVIVLLTSIISVYCLGLFSVNNTLCNIALLFFILIIASNSFICSIVSFLFLIFSALYTSTGLTYGKINTSVIVALINTDKSEAIDYITSTPPVYLILSIVMLLLACSFLYFSSRVIFTKKALLFTLLFVLININSWPRRMLFYSVADAAQMIKEKNIYHSLAGKDIDSWSLTENKHQKNTIIVVIGESVRKDYLSAFGYKYKTTPWLDKQNGIFFDHYISAAPNTITSLSRTLSLSDGLSFDFKNNIVNLTNKAGYHTYWISNQGSLGKNDTVVAAMASTANHKFFTKKADFNSENHDDFELLPHIYKALDDDHDKVIFVHMMGSHEKTCSRLFSFPNIYKNDFNPLAACYISSINKLDLFLEKIGEHVAARHKPYLLFYFSDHGLSIDNSPNPTHHCNNHRECYKVPLIIMSDKINDREHVDKYISAINFLKIFDTWTGIRVNNMPNTVNETTNDNIAVFNGAGMIKFAKLDSQKAM